MKFQVFPQDFEAVGCYRVLYPYGYVQNNTDHEVTVEIGKRRGKEVELGLPDPAKGVPEEDVFVFQRRLEKDAAPVAEWLRECGKTVVVELDDWYWDLPKGAPATKVIRNRPELSLESLEHQLRVASFVTVSTPRLGELVSQWNDSVHVLPNYLRRADWSQDGLAFEKDRGRVRIGWMGWLRYRGDDLHVLRGVVGPWLERHPECVFAQVGDEDPVVLDLLGVPQGQRLQYQGQVFPKHTGPTSMIDIGLVPLERTDFNESKSHLKGMEYAACGIPCIASPTGPYREWVNEGANGFLAAKPKDWFAALDAALETWREMGRNAHRKVQEHMIDDRWSEWLKPYESISAAEDSSSTGLSTSTLSQKSSRTLSPAPSST